VGYAAKACPLVKQNKATQQPMTSDGTVPQVGATGSSRMLAIRAAKALMRRNMALVGKNGGEGELCNQSNNRIPSMRLTTESGWCHTIRRVQ
jgi:hypothetical protein